jgi:hypothetical protein
MKRSVRLGVSLLSLLASASASAEGIEVLIASYGENCGVPMGNVTYEVKRQCDGTETCRYHIDVSTLGDPRYGCEKNYIVQYACSEDQSEVKTHYLRAEANGKTMLLSCKY